MVVRQSELDHNQSQEYNLTIIPPNTLNERV